jgi:hypothetical protein
MTLAFKIMGIWTSVEELAVGQEGTLFALRVRIKGKEWVLGPIPVRRVA